jgi:hypothetical protein
MARLGDGILDEGDVRFLRFRHLECRLRQHLEIEGRQQLAEFAQLAGIAGGEDKFFHVEKPAEPQRHRDTENGQVLTGNRFLLKAFLCVSVSLCLCVSVVNDSDLMPPAPTFAR